MATVIVIFFFLNKKLLFFRPSNLFLCEGQHTKYSKILPFSPSSFVHVRDEKENILNSWQISFHLLYFTRWTRKQKSMPRCVCSIFFSFGAGTRSEIIMTLLENKQKHLRDDLTQKFWLVSFSSMCDLTFLSFIDFFDSIFAFLIPFSAQWVKETHWSLIHLKL